jgi:hypothetical protein
MEEIGQARDAGAMLEARFRTPPASARARLDWRLPDGAAASSAVAADLDWISRAGLGGLQIENASASPQALRLVAQGRRPKGSIWPCLAGSRGCRQPRRGGHAHLAQPLLR